MASLDRHRVIWTGFLGAPGLSTFYCATGTPMNAALAAFWTTICAYLPVDVTLTIEPSGDTIDSATGALVGAWADTTPAVLAGTAADSYSAVSGALVQWKGATFLSGRRLRGHTFIVPLADGGYDNSGQIINGRVVGITGAATTLVATMGPSFVVWQRPRAAQPAYTDRRGVVHPAITARGGGYGPVLTGQCRPVVTELRSRRD